MAIQVQVFLEEGREESISWRLHTAAVHIQLLNEWVSRCRKGNKAGGSSWPVMNKVATRVLCTFSRCKDLRPESSPLHGPCKPTNLRTGWPLKASLCSLWLPTPQRYFFPSVISNSQKILSSANSYIKQLFLKIQYARIHTEIAYMQAQACSCELLSQASLIYSKLCWDGEFQK